MITAYRKVCNRVEELHIRTQAQSFIEAAHELVADEDDATFNAKLGVIARQMVKELGS